MHPEDVTGCPLVSPIPKAEEASNRALRSTLLAFFLSEVAKLLVTEREDETRKGIRHHLMSHKLLLLLMRRQVTAMERKQIKRLKTAMLKPRKTDPRHIVKALKRPRSKY